MAQDEPDITLPDADGEAGGQLAGRRRRSWRKTALILIGVMLALLVYAWLSREDMADSLISAQLESLGLPARYEIESIGPQKQVLRNVVVGDPERPDLTIERVEAAIEVRFGFPGIGRVTLVRPRLYGSYRKGRLSFGSLDKVLFTGSTEPFSLPDLDLAIVDGRGVMESDFGPIGLKLSGRGHLQHGFDSEIAAIAPKLQVEGCAVERASLYGRIRISGQKPKFTGPLRLGMLSCPERGLRVADAGLEVDATLDRALDGAEGRAEIASRTLAMGDGRLASLSGKSRFTFRKRALVASYEIKGKDLATPQVLAESLGLEGQLRSAGGFDRIETEGSLDGAGLQIARDSDEAMARMQRSAQGTLAAPVIERMRESLRREGKDSRLAASFVMRWTGDQLNLVVPEATLRGSSGQALVALSRVQFRAGDAATAGMEGNFSTGGEGLPRIAGRMESAAGGQTTMRLTMDEYRAGSTKLAVPRLALVRTEAGRVGFAGEARLSGELPGGSAEGLVVPLEGTWSARDGLAAWRKCTDIAFDRLAFSSLALPRQRLRICPPARSAVLRFDGKGARVAAGAPSLRLEGSLGSTPIRIESGPLGVAVPGKLVARSLNVTLGPSGTASSFRIDNIDAVIGKEVAGTFANAEIRLNAVRLDMLETGGKWRFANGRLTISQASFRLEDREVEDRFQPLVARDGTLSLADNLISAEALLREPTSDREVVRALIRHDLSSGIGGADLLVDNLVFDDKLQADMLTRSLLGVVANAQGVVRGAGRIDWNGDNIVSTGRFSTDSFGFAAAFGPARGISGTVEFSDLLSLVTKPDQQLRVASINPGIEVNDGVLTYEIRPNNALAVKGATWPFLDGTLRLHPAIMNMGAAEVRRFTLEVEGVSAARFVEQLELGNITATGAFDGVLPLVFDEEGGRVEGGRLRSRPPGGSVSYIGELTYKDLSAMANFAFDALKALDYREMTIGMDGALDGEMVTRVRFTGVKQGEGASANFVTKQLAHLPIQFNVNLRAPFFQLISSFKSMYDPAYVRDPRTLGLINELGQPISEPAGMPRPPAIVPDVQPSESGGMR